MFLYVFLLCFVYFINSSIVFIERLLGIKKEESPRGLSSISTLYYTNYFTYGENIVLFSLYYLDNIVLEYS